MKKHLLIISTTSRNNLSLAKNLNEICSNYKIITEMINLEEYDIPLYTPIEENKSIPIEIEPIMDKFINTDGFIICAPEYNGSIPPILTSLIAWLSIMKNNWRSVFNGKVALICTHSGGGGNNLIQSLRTQLNHLGTIVLPRTIIVNSYTKFDRDTAQEKVTQLIKFL